MGSKTTSQVTQAANPDAQAAYSDVVGKAQQVASTPYQPYTGELVAGLNGTQQQAVSQLAGVAGSASPFYAEGDSLIGSGAQGLGNVQNYLQAGSDATAGAAGYQGLGAASYGAAAGYGAGSAAALGGMAPYMGAAQGAIGQAQGYFGQASGLATPQSFDGAALSQFMNPYLSSVVDATRANLNETDAQQQQGLASNAIGSGAYGGDRAGVASAELSRQQSLADGQTIANLYSQGFGQAESEFNAVQGQRQQGASLLAGLGQGSLGAASSFNTLAQDQGQVAQQLGTLGSLSNATGSGYAGLAANSLGQAGAYTSLGGLQGNTGQAYGTLGNIEGALGSGYQSNLVSGASAGLQGGTLAQQNQQQQDTAAYNQYMAGLSYPYQNVGFLSNIVQGIGSQEGNTQTTQGNALSQIAGLGTSTIGLLGATGAFGSTGYLSGLGSSLSSAFSDARVKDDIASIGTTHDGQPIYRFRYKGDPRVQMGLMAQDVERRDPGAVGEVGGVKTVDYDRATRGAASLGLGLRPGDPRPGRAAGGPVGLGLSPMGGPMGGAAPSLRGLGGRFTPAPAGLAGLGARPRFDDGGAVPIPGGGLALTGVPGGGAGGLDMSPAALMGGSTMTARAPRGLGAAMAPAAAAQPQPQGLGVVGAAPVASSGPQGLGAAPAPSGEGGGLSPNAWMGVMAAGLGMMEGTSMSGLANVGAGASKGLQTYLGLQQQDANNSYRQGSLKIDQQRADQVAEQMRQQAEVQRQQLAIQSGTLANQTLSTNSEVAARNAATAAARYSRTFIPGQGWMVTDLTDPTKPPQLVPFPGQGAPSQGGGTPPPQAAPPTGGGSPAPTPMPTSSAPPPQGGVAASGAGAPPTASASAPAPVPTAGGPGRSSAAPSWQPTTTVPQGYVPPNQTGIYMNPGVLKGEQETAAKTIEGTRAEAQAAGGLQMRLDEMDRQYAQLPKTGLLTPGQAATARADIAKGVNTFASSLGAAPPFDPNALAANENLLKDRFRLGADLAKSMGGREPGFIVEQAVRANPGADNTPLAYQRITAGLRAASQYQQDRSAFFDDYNAKFGHLNGAQQAFDRLNPPQAYADRAVISTVDPRDVAAFRQNAVNPQAAAAIDRKYGIGTSSIIMGPAR